MESCFKSTNLHSDCRLVGVVGDPRKLNKKHTSNKIK